MPASPQRYPVKLTQAQRKVVAEIAPELADRLNLDEPDQRTIPFTVAELKVVQKKAAAGVGNARTGMKRNSLRHVTDLTTQALDRSTGIRTIPVAERLYQFKITLLDSRPPIWRRIQVKDCTLDKLHEHIQTAMGWTNSHLHHFKIGERYYGDPMLMDENFEEFGYEDSTTTKLSDILPSTGKRFRFEYEYDFGDSWQHEVRFEGCVAAEPGGGIRSAWKAHGPARPKTWAAPGATRNTWRRWPTRTTSSTTSCSGLAWPVRPGSLRPGEGDEQDAAGPAGLARKAGFNSDFTSRSLIAMRIVTPFFLLLLASPLLAAEPNIHTDVAYADTKNERHKLDVYAPTEGKNLPVVVWIHGGGWKAGDKKGVQKKPQAFADKGFVFVSVNYRFVPKATVKEMTGDVAKAIRWAHDHAKEYGGDPNSIFVMGHSAGGTPGSARLHGRPLSQGRGPVALGRQRLRARGYGCLRRAKADHHHWTCEGGDVQERVRQRRNQPEGLFAGHVRCQRQEHPAVPDSSRCRPARFNSPIEDVCR